VQRNVVVHRIALTLVVLLLLFAGASWADRHRREECQSAHRAIDRGPCDPLLTPAEPPLTVLEPLLQDGYYHVRTSAGEKV
jgi:hypothetical protein